MYSGKRGDTRDPGPQREPRAEAAAHADASTISVPGAHPRPERESGAREAQSQTHTNVAAEREPPVAEARGRDARLCALHTTVRQLSGAKWWASCCRAMRRTHVRPVPRGARGSEGRAQIHGGARDCGRLWCGVSFVLKLHPLRV